MVWEDVASFSDSDQAVGRDGEATRRLRGTGKNKMEGWDGVYVGVQLESLYSLTFIMEKKIAFLLLLLLLTQCEVVPVPLVIFSVSGDPKTIVSPAFSSLRGGKMIYIRLQGHELDPSANKVYAGSVECIIPSDGVTDTSISCETGDTGRTLDTNGALVTIVSGVRQITAPHIVNGISANTVNYMGIYTPQLRDIYPSAGIAGSLVNLYGAHRITNLGDGLRDMGDVVRLRIGEDICSRFDIAQDSINGGYDEYIKCKQSSSQEAGKYNVTEQVLPGFANNNLYMRRTSLDSTEYFEYTVLPTVTAVSPDTGNIGGQYLTVSGTGFSANPANNSISVDGNDCKITEASSDQLKCTLASKNSSNSALIPTDSGSQQNGYFSGAGLKYARYTITPLIDSLSEFVTAVRANNANSLGAAQETGYRADLREGNTYSANWAQTWNGYFTAPVTGTYTFRGIADDHFSFYIASEYGTSAVTATPLISNTVRRQDMNMFYTKDVASAEGTVDLLAGKSYYIEAFHLNYIYSGHFDIAVEVPNTDKTASFQAYQVDKVVTSSTVQPEKYVYSMVGATTGTLQLQVLRMDSNLKQTYNQLANVTYGASAEDFASALNTFDGFNSYVISVSRTIYDGSNNVLSSLTGAAKVNYEVEFYKLRPQALQVERFLTKAFGYNGIFTQTQTQLHSPLISGTFGLSIAGVDIKISGNAAIPFDVSGTSLQAAIRGSGLTGFGNVEVTISSEHGCGYSCTWIIQYKGFNDTVPNTVVNSAGLSGGSTTPAIVATIRRTYSSNLVFDPIDYRFLNTMSGAANVLVRTNGVPSVCTGTCLYTFNTFTQITSLSSSGTTLSLALSDPTAAAFSVSSITVSVGNQPCVVDGGSTLAALSCTMTANTDFTAILVAGEVTPLVYVAQYGIAGLATAPVVNPLSIGLVASSLSVITGGNNGGYLITLNGAGFPLDKSLIEITLCTNKATIKSVNNIKVTFYVPACASIGAKSLTVKVGTLTDSSLSFTYTDGAATAPIITALIPASANPGVKGILEISGEKFGTDASVVQVFLSNATGKIYQLNIFSISDTSIKVGLAGGLEGTFTVEVNLPAIGDSIAGGLNTNIFNYAFSVSSISPSTGSYNGGTLITITGQNFSTDRQYTLAYVGDTLNWFCDIVTITATQITCRTPAISRFYSAGTPVNVVVSTRLIILNSCTGTCQFTYNNLASSPTLTSISSSSISVAGASTQSITLTGTNLIDGLSFAEVSVKNTVSLVTTVYPATSSSATSVIFTVPSSLISGTYEVRVRNAAGESDARILSVSWSIGTPSWASGGSTAGSIVSITSGGGYPAAIDGKAFTVSVTLADLSSVDYSIVSCCTSNTIQLALPSAADGTVFTITFTGPTNTRSFLYTVRSTLTPTATITSPTTAVAAGTTSITFAASNAIAATIASIKLVSTIDSTQVITVAANTWATTGSGASASTQFSAALKAGSYKLIVSTTPNGYLSIGSTISVNLPSGMVASPQQVSFNGGSYTLTAANLSPSSYITANGFKGQILSYSASAVTYSIPALVTTASQIAFNLMESSLLDVKQFSYFSDRDNATSNVSKAFDSLITTFYGSNNAECWIGLDSGAGVQASVSRVRVFPNFDWLNVGKKILHAKFQGSNDKATWNTIALVDQTIHSGWNVLKSQDTIPYRYIRFSHNSTSNCQLAEFQLYGIFYSNVAASLTSQPTDLIYHDGLNTQTFTGAVEYRQDSTPVVTSLSPRYGSIAGGETLTLTGTSLNSGTATITIDGIHCPVVTAAATSITCTIGARPNTPTVANTFTVTFGNSNALLRDTFLYVLKWSSATTWGVSMAPIANDLIYVPTGTTLLVDQSTPILAGIVVEGGTLIFSDGLDLTVQAGFITLNGGKFIAGTEKHPHTRKLNFIMHGDYFGVQQPMFGNKGIGCLNCKFSMYGTPRATTWTKLTATINPGATSFTVADSIDWVQGEEVVVASTSFVHQEAERRTISSVVGKTVTVTKAFAYKHVSVVETYGTKHLAMEAEVGLLTRNIKMQGDAASEMKQYGSHLMLTGQAVNGFEGHIGYTEFTHCGQPQILGRYCMHFHMAGDVPTSFVRGNAVHDSFARILTIHGVHHLTIEDNVGHLVKGHNFFLEDGIETHNLIKHNLAVQSIASTRMLQTDTATASFWITHPTNDVIGNVAAGGDFYGFWYEIKEHPDGPSATIDVCPEGNPLGTVSNNIAHSNQRFGLRIFVLASRLFPCDPTRNDTDPSDPWSYNPSQQSVFSNFTVYKNLEDGVLAEETGNVVLDNFVIAESYHSGVEWYIANFTKEPPVIQNSVIVGMSRGNAHSNTINYTSGMSGAITGRSGTYKLSNIQFHNFPAGSVLLQTCRFCDITSKFTNLGTEVELDRITLTNVTGKMLNMIGLKRDIIRDLDGSLGSKFDGRAQTPGTIVHGWPHIAAYNQNTCPSANTAGDWDNAIMCDNTVTLRRVIFTNVINQQVFTGQLLKAAELSSAYETLDPNMTASLYSQVSSRLLANQPKKEKKQAWSLPYITGRTYNIWWGTGIDFSHLAISSIFADADAKGIIFRFNYTLNRELFEIGPMRGGAKQLTALAYLQEKEGLLDAATCNNGEYFHNNEVGSNRMLQICQSSKNRTKFEYTEVNGVICRFLCPAPAGTFIKEDFIRKWSNATQWPGGVLPQAGDNLTVNGNWTVILDVDPAYLNNLTVDGTLIADDTRDVNITANFIHIRAGNITAGSSKLPFLHNFTIQLNGQKTDSGFYIDPIIAASKLMVVTGVLNLHGVTPSTVTTTLSKTALQGSSTIFVSSRSDWVQYDTIVLSPSFSTYSQYETKYITAVNVDGSLTLDSPLAYTHYGAASLTIDNTHGTLDTRTRVGHVNRNVRIVAGPDAGWGFTVIVYGYYETMDILRVGSAQLSGVQFQNGGQLDTMNAPLTFINVKAGNYSSTVTGTSFVNCKASCVYVLNSEDISLTGNVLYNAWNYHIQLNQITKVVFNNNLMIGVYTKPSVSEGSILVACVHLSHYIAPGSSSIKNNYCMGSSQHGYVFPFNKCGEEETNPLALNTASSAKIGFILNTIEDSCQSFSYAKAFACTIGQICNPPGITTIKFDRFIMVDNGRSVTLKLGGPEGQSNFTAFLHNSFISALSRPNCAECYGPTATACTGRIGMRLLTASNNGERLPSKFGPGFDVICRQPLFDSKTFIVNTTFDNFRQSYTGAAAACGSNFAFKPHSSGFDMVGGANLYTSNCQNCDANSYLSAPSPSLSFLGWFGGCGDIVCTGFQNYLVQDHTGTFFSSGQKATIIPNNQPFAQGESGCTFSAPMNAYMCARSDFATLQYQNVHTDFKTRIMWPVTLKYEGSSYSTVTNGWRDWAWLGNEPLNQRFGRFVSLIRLGKTYNMTFAAEPPRKLQVHIQRREQAGNNSNYAVIKLHYPRPNSIRLLLNGAIMDPILLTDVSNSVSGLKEALNVSKCGSHIYFYTNYTIIFVVTAAANCLVQIELTESVQLTTHFAMNIADFFSSANPLTNFINNLCALLNIRDTSRVKVIGVFSGSTIITAVITPPADPSSNDTTTSAAGATLVSAIASGTFATIMGANVSTVIGASSTYSSLDEGEESDAMGLIVGISVAGVVLLLGTIVTVVCCMRRRAKVVEQVMSQDDEAVQEKESVEKGNDIHFMFSGSDAQDLPNDSEIKIKNCKAHQNALQVHQLGENSEIIDN